MFVDSRIRRSSRSGSFFTSHFLSKIIVSPLAAEKGDHFGSPPWFARWLQKFPLQFASCRQKMIFNY